jgi:ornithine cyclodeaminase
MSEGPTEEIDEPIEPVEGPLELRFLSKEEFDSLALDYDRVVEEIERGLEAHGNDDVVMPPKDHLELEPIYEGHYNVLKGYVGPIDVAGVKVIGDYYHNYKRNLPSELALLTLYRPESGIPFAIMDATVITWMRTGAVTAAGAKHLAREDSSVLGHIGSRGTAWYNVPMLDSLFDFDEIRVNSKRAESRERFAREMSDQLSKEVTPVDTSREAVEGADIIVDASRLTEPTVLEREEWIKPGALIIPYGAVMSVEPELPFEMDKIVVDDWEQAKSSQIGQLYPLIEEGRLRDEHVDAEIGEIVAGKKEGRTSEDDRILYWHKGFAVSDVMLGNLAHQVATEKGIGQQVTFYENPEPR